MLKPTKPGIWETYFKDVKFGPMTSWAGASAYAVYEFCGRYDVPAVPSYVAGGVTFAACIFLYLVNPKQREWVPPGAQVIDTLAPAIESRYQVRTISQAGGDSRPVLFADSEALAESMSAAEGARSVGVGPQGVPEETIPEARRNFSAPTPAPVFDPVRERIAELERQQSAAAAELAALKGNV